MKNPQLCKQKSLAFLFTQWMSNQKLHLSHTPKKYLASRSSPCFALPDLVITPCLVIIVTKAFYNKFLLFLCY